MEGKKVKIVSTHQLMAEPVSSVPPEGCWFRVQPVNTLKSGAKDKQRRRLTDPLSKALRPLPAPGEVQLTPGASKKLKIKKDRTESDRPPDQLLPSSLLLLLLPALRTERGISVRQSNLQMYTRRCSDRRAPDLENIMSASLKHDTHGENYLMLHHMKPYVSPAAEGFWTAGAAKDNITKLPWWIGDGPNPDLVEFRGVSVIAFCSPC
ncbi:uncharacterized protein AB9X84_025554 isoform 1-T1 [Acanthopagrus schlegelii]